MSVIDFETTTSVDTSWSFDDSSSTQQSLCIPDEFAIDTAGLREIYRQLVDILSEDEEDEESLPLRPSVESWKSALEAIQQIAYASMQSGLPIGSVTCNEGGVQIEWWNGRGCVLVSVNSENPDASYVFVKKRVGDDPGRLSKRVHPNRIASQIQDLFSPLA